jgi:hypothetical protein
MTFAVNLEKKLEAKLLVLSAEHDEPLRRAEAAIPEIRDTLEKLKSFILRSEFASDREEIGFFKNHKPLVLSKLIYYTDIFRIETRRPSGGEKMLRKYYLSELHRLQEFFEENVGFYGYYRTNSSYLDHKYFLREKLDYRLSLDAFVYDADSRFSTSHDYKVARIMANDLLEVYLNDELLKLSRRNETQYMVATPKTKLVWSDPKTALIEMIYGLYYKGCFNNGSADIKEISSYFEAVFSIELGDVYRTWIEIKNRSARTKFLSHLEETLNRKMEEGDE